MEMKSKRRYPFIGLTVLGLIGLLGASIAQIADMGEPTETPKDEIAQDSLTIVVPVKEMEHTFLGFHNWRGFALKDHETYILRISIEGVRPVGPMGARRFLASNMTIEEIKKEISAKEGNLTYRGHIKIGEMAYWLVNIKVTHDSENLTLNADIADLKESLTHEIITRNVGHIGVNTTSSEGTMKGQGEMTLTEGYLNGRYQLMLDMDPMPPRQEMSRYGE